MKKVAFYTQGCRLNQSETASIEQDFLQKEYQIVPLESGADIVIVNTCTVTENGDSDTKKLVNKINKISNKSKIALIGCQSQILKEQLFKLKNVEWVIGNKEKMNIAQIITTSDDKTIQVEKMSKEPFTIEKSSIDTRHKRANIKIQDGCDFYCSFCIIPFARGPARSRVFEDIIRECHDLVTAGHKEIVLTGINLGTYNNEDKNLVDVIKAMDRIEGLERIRISSIEPTTIPLEIIALMASSESKLCKYLHIPLQSGSNDILKAMSRNYSIEDYRSFITHAKESCPDLCIGTDVIVGFPGETKAHFDETVANLLTLPIDYFHVFSYSERTLARSKKLEQNNSTSDIKERSQILRKLSDTKKKRFYEQFLHSKQTILIEQKKKNYWTGLTEHFIRVNIPIMPTENLENTLVPVTFNQFEKGAILGERLT